MLDLEIVPPTQVAHAAYLFERDGFVAVENALTVYDTLSDRAKELCNNIVAID